jgi:poly(A) polymerase Pap1
MMSHRNRVLLELERIFQEWIKFVATDEVGFPVEEVAICGGQLFVGGSHRLGIREIGSGLIFLIGII